MSKVNPTTQIIVGIATDPNVLPVTHRDSVSKDSSYLPMLTGFFILLNLLLVWVGFFYHRPVIKDTGYEACLWEAGYHRKLGCGSIGKSECVVFSSVYPNNQMDPFSYLVEDNPKQFSNDTIHWDLGEVSICTCLDDYQVHFGKCLPPLTKWYNLGMLFNLLASICLLLPYKKNRDSINNVNNVDNENDNHGGECHVIISILLAIWGLSIMKRLQEEYRLYC